MKKVFVYTLLPLISLLACGCSSEPKESSNSSSPEELPAPASVFKHSDAPTDSIKTVDGENVLEIGNTYLSFVKHEDDSYGICIHNKTDKSIVAYNDKPAMINVRGPETGLISSYSETPYAFGYSNVEQKNYGYMAISTILTNNNSKIYVEDNYYLDCERGFNFNRTVSVLKANAKKDLGFSSTFSLSNGEKSRTIDDFEYFLPSILYKDTSNMSSQAIANNLYLDKVYVKETRMGLPMAMMRNIDSGNYISISHAHPKISSNGLLGGGASGDIDERIQYGAFGFIMNIVSVDFVYPCSEGPLTYDCGATWAKRYHPVAVNTSHTYKLSFNVEETETFNDALVKSYEDGYVNIDSDSIKIDNRATLLQNIDCFENEYREFGTGDIHSAGLPWELALDKNKIKREYSFQFGFVGMQSSVGAHLYREGLLSNDNDLINKGKTMVNFWSSSLVNVNYFPYVWWDGGQTSTGGSYRGYSCFLRCMVDGMEGILDAYNFGIEFGVDNPSWRSRVIEFADRLVAKQNDDGSFYRAYTTSGAVDKSKDDIKIQGESKLNTPVAIRFLAKMYLLTNNNIYKQAALKAADYSYTHIYEELGKYVGGTPDNPNVVDKEAAFYALYGFRYAYELSNDEKYEKAMVHAAVCSLSWVFVYDFACPSETATNAINPFKEEGHVIGFSIIATGHGAADNFSSWLWYDLYKTYESTNLEFFKKAAILIQHASKLSTDYDGRLGYLYKCLGPEASTLSDFDFKSVSVWLPWSGVANINPIVSLYRDYHVWQIEDINEQNAL